MADRLGLEPRTMELFLETVESNHKLPISLTVPRSTIELTIIL